MLSFIARVGTVQTGQSSGGFTAIIPLYKYFVMIDLESPKQLRISFLKIYKMLKNNPNIFIANKIKGHSLEKLAQLYITCAAILLSLR